MQNQLQSAIEEISEQFTWPGYLGKEFNGLIDLLENLKYVKRINMKS
jgi:hypothetical protein